MSLNPNYDEIECNKKDINFKFKKEAKFQINYTPYFISIIFLFIIIISILFLVVYLLIRKINKLKKGNIAEVEDAILNGENIMSH